MIEWKIIIVFGPFPSSYYNQVSMVEMQLPLLPNKLITVLMVSLF